MSTPELALVSEDWQVADDGHKPASLVVQLRRGVHILPWFRFVSAEGNNGLVKLTFASRAVTITGNDLAGFLGAIAAQRVIRVIQLSEHEAQFGVRGPGAGRYTGPAIHEITVEKFK
jgi:hypothetical protein